MYCMLCNNMCYRQYCKILTLSIKRWSDFTAVQNISIENCGVNRSKRYITRVFFFLLLVFHDDNNSNKNCDWVKK